MSYKLEDGEQLNKKNPRTFHIPSKVERDTLKTGDIVKLIFLFDDEGSMPERMWVKIISKDENQYKGILDNDPYTTKTIKAGDDVIFGSENIIQIYS